MARRVGIGGLLVLLLAGCGARKEYAVARLEVGRLGWDTLRVDVAYVVRTTLGPERTMLPDGIIVTAFDADYDTLYAGTDRIFAVPDAVLGSREFVIVEVCGAFSAHLICEQTSVSASPKRLRAEAAIDYPYRGDRSQGTYSLRFVVEREAFGEEASGDEAWERLGEGPDVDGYLLARIAGEPESAVRVPFARRSGRFDLSRYGGYRDFKYFMETALLDEREAVVLFDVFAGVGGEPEHLATVEKTVELKSREEREAEVRFYVEHASEQLVERLQAFLGGRRLVAYVDEWTFEPVERGYRIETEIQWRGSFFDGRRYSLTGLLTVAEDGSNALFRLTGGNERGTDRWRDRIGTDVLALELPPYRPGEDAE